MAWPGVCWVSASIAPTPREPPEGKASPKSRSAESGLTLDAATFPSTKRLSVNSIMPFRAACDAATEWCDGGEETGGEETRGVLGGDR